MVKHKDFILQEANIASINNWLEKINDSYAAEELQLIQQACRLLQDTAEHAPSEIASKLISSLWITDTLTQLNLDYQALIAALLYEPLVQNQLSLQQIKNDFGDTISKLLAGVLQLNNIRNLQSKADKNRDSEHVDKLRKMLVAMVDDVRVVLIKLAERIRTLHLAIHFEEAKRRTIAQEVSDIYAPLANRLGVWQLKWELEDLSFRYLQPEIYLEITKAIKNRRIERDELIEAAMNKLTHALTVEGLKKFDISGRAKHIYSIYKKMQRKDVDYQEIYDSSAIRVLVPEIADCYVVLSIVHNLWRQIPREFDDYIHNPKPNGYRSIHTAVIGPGNNNLEIQIRTYRMHEESELGVAAHWAYKEGKTQRPQQLDKIAWLRQVLDWQKELIQTDSMQSIESFDKHVYVFSPAGDVIDLPKGATPLDFAYAIHSQIGHRCRGAKINGAIVPLTYHLQTGDQVEILTAKLPNPSRDWYNPHAGYLVSPRARAKVQQWFKQLDYDKHVADGHELLARELHRLGIHEMNLDDLAHKLQFNHAKDMYAALGSGSLRLGQVAGAIAQFKEKESSAVQPDEVFITKQSQPKKPQLAKSAVNIGGIDNLLTHMAGCCKPVPGDKILGYITQGHGVSIHRQSCPNIPHGETADQRLIEVTWNDLTDYKYPVDLQIIAQDRAGLLRDITTALTVEKINIDALNCTTSKTNLTALVNLTVEISTTKQLEQVIQRLSQLPTVLEIKRAHQ
jgi:GTP pyrophosphokinase